MNNNVTDYDNHRIQVLNFDLTFSFTFGERGQDSSRLSNPCGITCDSAGNAYVVDSGNHRIQVFTAEGEFLRMFGQKGKGRDEFNVPVGIALRTRTITICLLVITTMSVSQCSLLKVSLLPHLIVALVPVD